MTEKDNSFNLKYATFSAKMFKWQILTNFYMYRVFQLDMTYFEVPDDQQKLTSKF